MGRQLLPCGTNAAYARHIKAGEDACDPCKTAHNEDEKARLAGTLPPRKLKPCGTLAAAKRHRQLNEELDLACHQAEADYTRQWRADRKRAAERAAAFDAALTEVLAGAVAA